MLVLSRKCGEEIEIGGNVKVTIVRINGNQVRVGIEAPKQVSIRRPGTPEKLELPQGLDVRPLRILVVDDNPEDRDVYRRIMSAGAQGQYVLSETDTGEEGLASCRAEAPDCVLLDYMLPDCSGLEFLAELSGVGGQLPVPVVMLTGHGDESIAVQAMKQGVHDYLPKRNITGDLLRGAVRGAMTKAGLAPAGRLLSRSG